MVSPWVRRFANTAFLGAAVFVGCSGLPEVQGETPTGGSGGTEPGAGGSGGGAGEPSSGGTTSSGGSTLVAIGGTNAGGEGGGFETCAHSTTKAELVPANLLFVIDSSGSMNCNPPDGDSALGARCARFPIKEDPNRPSKWEITTHALLTALEALLDRPRLSAGLSLFPSGSECGVGSSPTVPLRLLSSAQLSEIENALGRVKPQGETPLAGATILSYAHLADELRARKLTGNSFVILLTDGAETCAPNVLDQLLDTDVPNARLFDIRTFVIGAPGSEATRALLSQIAWEGGTASSDSCNHSSEDPELGDCHFDTTTAESFEQQLSQTLQDISRVQEIACTIDVPQSLDGEKVDLDRVNVTFTPEGLPSEHILNDLSATCSAGANGWQYTEDKTKISLCGDACTRVREVPGQIQVVLGCPTEIVR